MSDPANSSGAPGATGLSNLQLRIISAIVLAAAVLALAWLGGVWFRLFAAALAAAILYEWLAMARSLNRNAWAPVVLTGIALVLLIAGAPVWLILFVVSIAPILALISSDTIDTSIWPAAGVPYAVLSAMTLALLRGGDQAGLVALLFLFATVWATDILAYFVGRAIGGPKLAPSISPGKTWSGAIGGTLGGVIAGGLVAWFAGAPVFLLIGSAAILSVVSQFGDLFESWVKRRHGVKDSSRLIPGHGGVMDRVDGLVVAALALYLIGAILGSPEAPAAALFQS